jgi:hypothetical protein
MNLLPYVPFALVIALSLLGGVAGFAGVVMAPSRLLRCCWAVLPVFCMWVILAAIGSIDAGLRDSDGQPLTVYSWNVRFPGMLAVANLLLIVGVYIFRRPVPEEQPAPPAPPVPLVASSKWGEVENCVHRCLGVFTVDDIRKAVRTRLGVSLEDIVPTGADAPQARLRVVEWCHNNGCTRALAALVCELRQQQTGQDFAWLREWLKGNPPAPPAGGAR